MSVERSFIDETHKLTLHQNTNIDMTKLPGSNKNNFTPSGMNMCTCTALRRFPDALLSSMTSSLTTLSGAIPESNHICSEDANILLLLLSFLDTAEKIPVELLSRGATPRKRWSSQGMIEETSAIDAGLSPEICSLLSDIPRLGNAFKILEMRAIVSKHADQAYILTKSISHLLHGELSAQQLSFWKLQALIVAYRAIPWKYIEPM